MLPQPARRNVRGAGSLLAVLAGLSATLSSLSCEKVPLLAPTGSVITLFATATTVPSNGSMEIVATVIEQGTSSSTDDAAGAPGHRDATDADLDFDTGRRHSRAQRHGRYLYDDDRPD